SSPPFSRAVCASSTFLASCAASSKTIAPSRRPASRHCSPPIVGAAKQRAPACPRAAKPRAKSHARRRLQYGGPMVGNFDREFLQVNQRQLKMFRNLLKD